MNCFKNTLVLFVLINSIFLMHSCKSNKETPNELLKVVEFIKKWQCNKSNDNKLDYTTGNFNINVTINSPDKSKNNFLNWEAIIIEGNNVLLAETEISFPAIYKKDEECFWFIFCEIELKNEILLELEFSAPKERYKTSKDFKKVILIQLRYLLRGINEKFE